ncbi:MAG: hypothetical protein AB1806_02180 [Acidobacteriota bacterium]
MRHLAAVLVLVPLLAPGPQAQAQSTAGVQRQDTQRSVSLVLRVKPDQLRKAASDLAHMVQGGESLGLPWLKEAFGSISAEIVVEDADPSGGTLTAFRASSAGWIGTERAAAGPVRDDGHSAGARNARGDDRPTAPAHRYATAAAIIGRHAMAIRDGASALVDSLPADKAAELRQQLEQLTTSAGTIGRAVEGLIPERTSAGRSGADPKR